MAQLSRLQRQVRRTAFGLPNGLYCFNYHRIGDPNQCDYDPNIFSCSEQRLAEHLTFFKANFELLSFDQLCKSLETGQEFSRPSAVITFDDGYLDNYQLAYPLLKKFELSAAFFVVTDFVDSHVLPWWDHIAWLLRKSNCESIKLDEWPRQVPINRANISESIQLVLRQVKLNSAVSIESQVLALGEKLEVAEAGVHHSRLFMNWNELNEMVEGGMHIGSHSSSHNILRHMHADRQRQELSHSRSILAEHLNQSLSTLAYPVGGENSFDDETQAIAKESGYDFAFSFISGINVGNLNKKRYALSRISIDDNISVASLERSLRGIRSV